MLFHDFEADLAEISLSQLSQNSPYTNKRPTEPTSGLAKS